MNCDYCTQPARLVNGRAIYPHRPDLYPLMFWLCRPCCAYVGTHKNSQKHAPLGRLANPELRDWKKRAHAAFDPAWKAGAVRRKEAYVWLSVKMGIPFKDCHIGMFDIQQCKRVIELVAQLKGP